jgi:hypothetical protein
MDEEVLEVERALQPDEAFVYGIDRTVGIISKSLHDAGYSDEQIWQAFLDALENVSAAARAADAPEPSEASEQTLDACCASCALMRRRGVSRARAVFHRAVAALQAQAS